MGLRHKRFLCSLLILACSAFSFASANAATPTSPAAIQVVPALENLVQAPHQNTISYSSTITNATNTPVSVTVSTTDFTTLGTNGSLVFISQKQAGDHSLAQAISISDPSFILAAHASQQLTISINNASALTGGGHYGSVLYRTTAVLPTSVANHVQFQQTIASLIFLTSNGQGSYGLGLSVPHTGIVWSHFPNSLNLLFSNTGNVQAVPRGYVNVTNPFGTQVSKNIINPNSGVVLPGTQRLLQTSITSKADVVWPGIYTVRTYYRYDGETGFKVLISHIVYINLGLCLVIILVFIILYLCAREIYSSVRK
jgi:hypothetical protein